MFGTEAGILWGGGVWSGDFPRRLNKSTCLVKLPEEISVYTTAEPSIYTWHYL